MPSLYLILSVLASMSLRGYAKFCDTGNSCLGGLVCSSNLCIPQLCNPPTFILNNDNVTCSCGVGFNGNVNQFTESLWTGQSQSFSSGCTLDCVSNGYCTPLNFPFNSSNWFNEMTYLQGDSTGFAANRNTSSTNNIGIQLTSSNSTGTQYNGFFYSSRIQDLTSFTLSFEFYSSIPCYQEGNGCHTSGNMLFFIGASEPVLWRDSGTLCKGNDDSVTSYLFDFETMPFSYNPFVFTSGLALLDSNLNVMQMAADDPNNPFPFPASIEWIGAQIWSKVEISYNRRNVSTWVVSIDNGNGPVVLIDYSDINNEAWIAQSGSLFGITAASFTSDYSGNIYGSNEYQVRNLQFIDLGEPSCVSNIDCLDQNRFCSGGYCKLIPCHNVGFFGSAGFCECDAGFYGNVIYTDHSLTGCKSCPLNAWSVAGTNKTCSLIPCPSIIGFIGNAGHCECDVNYFGNVTYVSGKVTGCHTVHCRDDSHCLGGYVCSLYQCIKEVCPSPSFALNDSNSSCSCGVGFNGNVNQFTESLWTGQSQSFSSGCTLDCVSNGYCSPLNFPFNSSNWFRQMTYLRGDSTGFLADQNTVSTNNIGIQLTSENSTRTQHNGFFYSSRIQDLTSFTLSFDIYSSVSCYLEGYGCLISGNMLFFIGASEPVLWRDKSGTLSNGNDDSVTSYLFNFETMPFSSLPPGVPHSGLTLMDSHLHTLKMALNPYVFIDWIGDESWSKVEISYNRRNVSTWVVSIDNGNGPVVLIDYSDINNEAWIAQSGSLFGITAASFTSDSTGNVYGSEGFQIRNLQFIDLGEPSCVSNIDCLDQNRFCSGGYCKLIPCHNVGFFGSAGFCECDAGFYGNVIYTDHSLTGCKSCPLNAWSVAGTNKTCSLIPCPSIIGFIGNAGHCECDVNYFGNITYVSGSPSGCKLISCNVIGYYGSAGYCQCFPGFFGVVTYDDHSLSGCKPCAPNTSSFAGNTTSCSYEAFVFESLANSNDAQKVAMHTIARLANGTTLASYVSSSTYPCEWVDIFSCKVYNNQSYVTGVEFAKSDKLSMELHLFDNFKFLKYLDTIILSSNNLYGSLPPKWASLLFLKRLYLDRNNLDGTLPVSYSSLVNLLYVQLYSNNLSGSLPTEWETLINLIYLLLSNNNIKGTLPTSWSSLINLAITDISSNMLEGTLPSSWSTLIGLLEFSINNNNLNGSLPETWSTWRKIESFYVNNNNLVGTLPSSYSSWINLSKLKMNNNNLEGPLPTSWSTFVNLNEAHLNNNNLNGTLPSTWSSLLNLHQLYLNSNSIGGKIPITWSSLLYLDTLNLVSNCLTDGGSQCGNKARRQLALVEVEVEKVVLLQEREERKLLFTNLLDYQVLQTIVTLVPALVSYGWHSTGDPCFDWRGILCNGDGNIVSFFLHDIALNVDINSFALLANVTQLTKIQIDNCGLFGNLPTAWSSDSFINNLYWIWLSNNNLEGTLLDSWAALINLQYLHLDNNNLRGTLPNAYSSLINLFSLFLDNNNLEGTLPSSWSAMANLNELKINNNNLVGTLPSSWSQISTLSDLYLNNNHLNGTVPTSWLSLNLWHIFLNDNELSGNYSTWNAFFEIESSRTDIYFSVINNFIYFDTPVVHSSLTTYWYPQNLPEEHNAVQNILSSVPALLWSSRVNMCLLNGISCTTINSGQYAVIKEINLSNKNLTYPLSIFQSLKASQHLVSLDLSGNRLIGNLIDFTGFQSLIQLNLRDNMISGEFGSSPFPPQIQVINLGGNKLTGHISFKSTEDYTFDSMQLMNLSSNSFSAISETFDVSSSYGTIITILDNSMLTDSGAIVPLPITCPFPILNEALFLHDLCRSDLSVLTYLGIAAGVALFFFSVMYTLYKGANINRWRSVTAAHLSIVHTNKILVYGSLLYYDLYVDICMYSYMLIFIANDKLNVIKTCQLLNTSNIMLYLTPSVGNLTLDVISDLKLLALDPMLNENLMTNITTYFIPKVLAATDIFKNPSIAMEFNNVANQTCLHQSCVFDYASSTCSAPLVYKHQLFQNLVYASIYGFVVKECVCSLATLYFTFFSATVPEAFRSFVIGSITFPFLLLKKGRAWFGKEIIDFVPRKRDRISNLFFSTILVDMNQLAINTWFIVFISQSGITGVTLVVIPINLAKLAFSLLQLLRQFVTRNNRSNSLVTVSTLTSSRVITVEPESRSMEMERVLEKYYEKTYYLNIFF